MKQFKNSLLDIVQAIKNYQFWITYGKNDIISNYRRTKLGTWWVTLTVVFFIIVIGGIFRGAFYPNESAYLAYLSIGYISWIFMQDCVTGSCSILIQSKPFMLQKEYPVSLFALRFIYKEIMILLHHVAIIPIVFIWLGYLPSINEMIFGLCGLLFSIFTAFWVSLFLSIICLRYLDLAYLIRSLMRMAFFATPVIWIDKNIGKFGEMISVYNPFGYFLKIIRDPLLGYGFPSDAWFVAIIISIFCIIISLITLSITKNKITYWL